MLRASATKRISATMLVGDVRIFPHALHTSGDSSANSSTRPEPRLTPAVEMGTAHRVTSANVLARNNWYDSVWGRRLFSDSIAFIFIRFSSRAEMAIAGRHLHATCWLCAVSMRYPSLYSKVRSLDRSL